MLLRSGEINHFETEIRPLMLFADGTVSESKTLPIEKPEYLKLVDVTGRVVAKGNQGRIDPELMPILQRLRLSVADWTQASSSFQQYFRNGDLRVRQAA